MLVTPVAINKVRRSQRGNNFYFTDALLGTIGEKVASNSDKTLPVSGESNANNETRDWDQKQTSLLRFCKNSNVRNNYSRCAALSACPWLVIRFSEDAPMIIIRPQIFCATPLEMIYPTQKIYKSRFPLFYFYFYFILFYFIYLFLSPLRASTTPPSFLSTIMSAVILGKGID